jgi:hypothetical protein
MDFLLYPLFLSLRTWIVGPSVDPFWLSLVCDRDSIKGSVLEPSCPRRTEQAPAYETDEANSEPGEDREIRDEGLGVRVVGGAHRGGDGQATEAAAVGHDACRC